MKEEDVEEEIEDQSAMYFDGELVVFFSLI